MLLLVNMKEKISLFLKAKIAFLKKNWKWSIAGFILVLIIVSQLLPKGFDSKTEIVEQAKIQDLKKTVKVTGDVTSVVNLELAFNSSGRIQSVDTFLGQKVYKGQILASLNAGSELGQLNQAYGALKFAKASLAKVLEGATSEEVEVAKVALDNANRAYTNTKKLQDTLVRNAKATMYSTDLQAVSSLSSSNNIPVVSGTYGGQIEDEYTLNIYSTGSGAYVSYSSLSGDNGTFPVAANAPIALGTKGLYLQFSSSTFNTNETFKIKIPNISSISYNTHYNNYLNAEETRNNALENALATINNAQANLDLKIAEARPSDILAKEADVLIAQGRVQSAQGVYEEKIIRAPLGGIITKLDINPGENVEAKKVAIVLEDKGGLFLEAGINESDINLIKVGQTIDFTVDTLGVNEIFKAEVTHIDGAPTKDGSIVNFKIKANILTGQDKIQSGSTANLSILIQEKSSVVTVPNRTIYKKEDGTNYVLIVTDEDKGKTKEQIIEIGFQGDGALTEITNGLNGTEKLLFKAK